MLLRTGVLSTQNIHTCIKINTLNIYTLDKTIFILYYVKFKISLIDSYSSFDLFMLNYLCIGIGLIYIEINMGMWCIQNI